MDFQFPNLMTSLPYIEDSHKAYINNDDNGDVIDDLPQTAATKMRLCRLTNPMKTVTQI
jgi:hypothetical protein